VRRVVVIEEQRYGPRWLRDNDDDDDESLRREPGRFMGADREQDKLAESTS